MTPEHAEALAKRGIVYKPWPSLLRAKPAPVEGVPCRGCGTTRVPNRRHKCEACKTAAGLTRIQRERNREREANPTRPPKVCACGARQPEAQFHGNRCLPCYNAAYRAGPGYAKKLERERLRQRARSKERVAEVTAWRKKKRAQAAAAPPEEQAVPATSRAA